MYGIIVVARISLNARLRNTCVPCPWLQGSLAERAVPDPRLDLPGAWQMACPQLSVGRGRLCLDAVKVAVHLLGDWGEGLVVDGTYCERTAGDDEAAMALLEVTAAAREMVSRLERIADLSRMGSVPESDKEVSARPRAARISSPPSTPPTPMSPLPSECRN